MTTTSIRALSQDSAEERNEDDSDKSHHHQVESEKLDQCHSGKIGAAAK